MDEFGSKWLRNFVKEIKGFKPTLLPNFITRKASVNIIIRVRGRSQDTITNNPRSLEELFEAPWFSSSIVEMLFIKRADRKGDIWSGHVAFPGGKREEDETDIQCGIRETFEEIGVDLSDKSTFEYLGRLSSL
eukprot:TRINITY_DN2051_c0_g1_i4.p2 TRINITY_DN2051_c0_g1~~TRINITY_DN2051_c0_g1_i4.p2  ORF type:complete len:133 (+),score=29.93 TRINITY_DN2051_c0_g1_i4:17-415(+)